MGDLRGLEKNRAERLKNAAVFMNKLHRQVCEEQGDHHEEVDTAYSLAFDALHFNAAAILRALEAEGRG